MASLSDAEAAALVYDWRFWARPNQLWPDGGHYLWLILAGRGWGKTRSGAEWCRMMVEEMGYRRGALLGRTAADVRDVMIEGDSGILSVCPSWNKPEYNPSKRRITWPNGALMTAYSADKPDMLRGPQHDFAWVDEPASFRYPEAFDMLLFGLRLGHRPLATITGTPKPVGLIKELIKNPDCKVTKGTTYDNRDNLAQPFLNRIIQKYEGTRLGRQEIYADILDDLPGAMWTRSLLDRYRVPVIGFDWAHLDRIVVAVDPAVSNEEQSNETGIVVAARSMAGEGYLLDDRTLSDTPAGWGKAAVDAYHKYKADCIICEVNQGGDMVEHVIRTIDPRVAVRQVRATRGKHVRAEPVSNLAERGVIHHVGSFPELEDQLCLITATGYEGEGSPDRADAYVWAFTDLLLGQAGDSGLDDLGVGRSVASGSDW